MRFRALLLTAALTSGIVACTKPAEEKPAPEPSSQRAPELKMVEWTTAGTCAGHAMLMVTPRKLTDVPIELHTSCPAHSITVTIDMPAMPMNVAPTALKKQGNTWTGTLVFTMSGAWRINIAAVDAKGEVISAGSKDVDIP